MADKEINVLTDLDTLGVSLVKRGANKRRVALTKSEEGMEGMEEVLKAVLEMETDDEAKIEEVFKALSPKGANAVKGAMRLLNAFRDELPEDIMSGLAKLAKVAAPKKEGEDEKYPVPKKKQEEEVDEDKLKKTMENVPQELRETLQQLWKSQEDQIKKHEEEVKKAEEERDKLAKELSVERDARVLKEMVEKAEANYGALGSAAEVGALLKDLRGAGGELADKVEELLKAANERVLKSDLLAEAGTSGRGDSGAESGDKLEALAKERAEKSGGKLSFYKAYDQIVKENPELYNEYLTEKGAH